MNNKSFLSLVLGLIIFGLLLILVNRMKNTPTAVTDENLVYGSVILPETISQFAAEGVKEIIEIKPDKGIVKLPAGKYHSRLWRVERKDDEDNTWALTGQIFDNQGFFEVHEGNQTKLDLGEPIIATVDASKSGSIHSFNQIINGRLNEHVELARNGSRPRAPKLNIKNKDGTYDRTFSFEYG